MQRSWNGRQSSSLAKLSCYKIALNPVNQNREITQCNSHYAAPFPLQKLLVYLQPLM